MTQHRRRRRPSPLPEPALTYRTEDSVHPDQIRLSFDDGSTAIYDLRTEFPHPIIERNIEIIRKIKTEYVNQPMRRRRKA